MDDGYDCIKIDFFTFKPDDGTYTDTDRLGLLSKEYLKMYESRLKACLLYTSCFTVIFF